MSRKDGKGSEDGHMIFMPGFSVQDVKKEEDILMDNERRLSVIEMTVMLTGPSGHSMKGLCLT